MLYFVVPERLEMLQEFFKGKELPSPLSSSFCSFVLLVSEILMFWIAKLIFSVFVIYYSLICSVIRVLFGHLLHELRCQILKEEYKNLLDNYEKISKGMRKMDKVISFPTFIAILMSMIGLFWGGYRLAFKKYVSNKYLVSRACSVSCYLTFLLLIMISASMTNEIAKKVKNTLQCLKYRFSRHLRENKFKEVCTKENNLTLWKIYVLDRSLEITVICTLLTFGILIGTLGQLLMFCIGKFIISVYVIYYSLVCRVIRLLFDHLLDETRRQGLQKDYGNLLDNYKKITKSMRKVNKELSFPTFVAIIMSMTGLFWGGYRLAFRKYFGHGYSVTLLCSVCCYLSFQLLIIISASMTNEIAKRAKITLRCLKYKIPPDLRETKFEEVLVKENNLTLWNIYVLDSSLLISSFGTLLTFGILIGSLGESC
ncbi:uncharacterized protein TNCT_695811 [Trichonephila clavata]|uniref:Gustatory receptor n=1 Tax=Trichonephila clavata TaxID=2740835 RepID=A0A8X6HYE2_TRICU|nr:uncharacterized protein TNCT_695811 [Trichonephila clavata]